MIFYLELLLLDLHLLTGGFQLIAAVSFSLLAVGYATMSLVDAGAASVESTSAALLESSGDSELVSLEPPGGSESGVR